MILSKQRISRLGIVSPMSGPGRQRGMSYGLGPASYDFRAAFTEDFHTYTKVNCRFTSVQLGRGGRVPGVIINPAGFILLPTRETFRIPEDVMGIVHPKSTWVRQGLLTPPVVFDPGFNGVGTIMLQNLSPIEITVASGDPIGQMVFHILTDRTATLYAGKYQHATTSEGAKHVD